MVRSTLLTLLLVGIVIGAIPTQSKDTVAIPAESQIKIATAAREVSTLQVALDAARSRLQASIFEAMAKAKVSPDEYEIVPLDDNSFIFRKKPPKEEKKP